MEFDHVLRIIGEFGPHQRRLYVLLNLSLIPAAFQLLLHVFVGAEPIRICSLPNETCNRNSSACSEVEYSSKSFTIIAEWNLVCKHAFKADLVQSVLMTGSLFGALVLGTLADRYGRRKIWYISFTGLIVFAFASSFAPTYKIYTLLRFLTGFFVGGEILSAFVLATELIGPSYRGFAGTMAQCFFTCGLLILPIIAYLVRDWRTLTVLLSLPFCVFILLFRIVPESARWLVIRGRLAEAEEVLSTIARKNGIAVPKVLLQVSPPMSVVGNRYGCLDLFSNLKIAKITLVLFYLWFVNALVYYGLSLNTKHLGGDIYKNFFLSSLMEVPAYLTSVCLINWIGRRRSICYYMMLGGTACLVCLFFQTGTKPVYRILTTTFAMIGKFGISASFAVIYVYSAELLPTVVRNVGMGVCSMASRIGGIGSPFVVFLGIYSRPLPMMIFGMCSFSAGLLSLVLPETLNKPLPESLEETGFEGVEGVMYEQLEMEQYTRVLDANEDVFHTNDSDFDEDIASEKTTFI